MPRGEAAVELAPDLTVWPAMAPDVLTQQQVWEQVAAVAQQVLPVVWQRAAAARVLALVSPETRRFFAQIQEN